jgi:hypothetical protein
LGLTNSIWDGFCTNLMQTTKSKDWPGQRSYCKSWKNANKMTLLHCYIVNWWWIVVLFRVPRIRSMGNISRWSSWESENKIDTKKCMISLI